MARVVGVGLVVAAFLFCLVGVAWLGINLAGARDTSAVGGAILGFALLLIVVSPLLGGGVLVLARSRQEQTDRAKASTLRKVLDMVKTRGEVSVTDLVIELRTDLPSVQAMVYELVGMGIFSGYVNWDEGTLYSLDAVALGGITQCKHCGGRLSLAGKGVLRCQYCTTEYFLS